ncbi:phage Baseplate Assembly protein V [Enterobacter hormaechei]|nr:hypothetical protein L422_04456 [Enterobacter hormaechei]CZZ64162.1 phage Baseplate Assembly protein V [Enterobacter hormaechei]
MNNLNSLQEIARAIRNLIRTGIVTDVDHDEGLCRVQTGGMETTWLNWLNDDITQDFSDRLISLTMTTIADSRPTSSISSSMTMTVR